MHACYFRVTVEYCNVHQAYVLLIDIDSLQACASHIVEFFDAGGKYDAAMAASPALLCEDVIEAELDHYTAYYPSGTIMARLHSKLKEDTSLADINDPRVSAIMNSVRNLGHKRQ